MTEHHPLVWQRRTLFAVAAAATSFTLGLLWPLVQGDGQGFKFKLGLGGFASKPTAATALALDRAQGFDNLLEELIRLDDTHRRIFNFTAPQEFQGKTINDVKVPGERKAIALTFDDGPWPGSTNDILYILKKNQIKATFFLLGRNVQNYPDLAKKIVGHGHVVANHSWSHPYHRHSEAAAAQQLDRTDAIIEKATGVKSTLFRPPGGYLNNGLAAYAAKKKNVVVMWSADSQDYRASGPAMVANVMRYSGPGGIVLMHDGGGDRARTVGALPVIIEKLQKQGYEFVTVPELLEMKEEQQKQQQPQTSGS